MNYELLSRLAIEDAEKSKNESFILRKRNEILHNEIDTLKARLYIHKLIIREDLQMKKKTF